MMTFLMQLEFLPIELSAKIRKNLIALLLVFFSIFCITCCYADNYRLVSVGESFGGGTVFCVSQTSDITQCVTTGSGYAGLIMANEDQVNYDSNSAHGVSWSSEYSRTGAVSFDNGAVNTAAIVAALPYDNSTNNVAWLCHSYIDSIEKHTDWYLPAKNELNKMYLYAKANNLIGKDCSGSKVGGVQCLLGGCSNSEGVYWSSTEDSDNTGNAWFQWFSDGVQFYNSKVYRPFGARAIRAFTSIKSLQAITVTTNSLNLAQGSTRQFVATGTYSDGSMQNITNSTTWNSSNTAISTISNRGLATGLNAGTVNITASQEGITSLPVELTVITSPVVSAISKSGVVNKDLLFGAKDFFDKFDDIPDRSLVKVKITSLPMHGTLKIGQNSVALDEEVPVANLNSLIYEPGLNWIGEDSFWWVGVDECLYSLNEAPVVIGISEEPFSISFFTIASPQKVNVPFTIKILANKNNFNGAVSLYSALGKVEPDHVDLVNGEWVGDITLFDIGEDNYLKLRWSDETYGSGANISNIFNVTNQEGDIAKDAILEGKVTNDDYKPIAGATIELFDGDPNLGGHLIYSTMTDSNGRYSFYNIFSGDYYLSVQMFGYQNVVQETALASKRIITADVMLYYVCDTTGKTPVLLVPGIMGSYSTAHPYWLPFYPRLEEVPPAWDSSKLKLFDPGCLSWQVGWSTIKNGLEEQGYESGCTIFSVPYDWSLSVPQIRDQYLVPWINEAKRLSGRKKVDVIAHSMGGLVTRSYIQSDLYADDIRKFAVVGTPSKGSDSVYYIWEGGDPIEADIVAGNTWFSNPFAAYFYTNVLDYLNLDRYGSHVCNFVLPKASFTPTNCDRDKIYDSLHNVDGSPGQLIPIYDRALLNTIDGNVQIVEEENTFLKALNNIDCLNPKGCVDSQGNIYSFTDPQFLFSAKNDTGVQTILFMGDKQKTLASIYVEPQPPNYAGRTYQDGIPQDQDIIKRSLGDGTVLTDSVFFDERFPQKLNFIAKPAEHAFLIKEFTPELVGFITGNGYIPSKRSLQPETTLAINIDGRIQPGFASVVNSEGKLMKSTEVLEQKDFKISSSSLKVENPVNGEYNVLLYSPYNEDYELSISYYNTNTDKLFEQRYLGYFDSSSKAFTFFVNNTSLDNPIVFDRAFNTPTDLVISNTNDKIQLSWQDVIGDKNKDVNYYEVYWQPDTDPYMNFLGKTAQKRYFTNHDWQDASTNTYAVRSMIIGGNSTFLSPPIFFIPEESKIKNRHLN
jgi:pimeloyl-ACP methyl ester carboxylesterase